MDEKDILKNIKNNIYLTENQIDILNKYSINYEECNSLDELIMTIERYLLYDDYCDDLESVSQDLADLKYYNFTNK